MLGQSQARVPLSNPIRMGLGTRTARVDIHIIKPGLTYWGRVKMAVVFQTTFSNAFSWMKMYEFQLKFHWILFPRVQLTIFQHWFRQWLGAGQATSHYLNQWWLVYWCIYESLCLNELNGSHLAYDTFKWNFVDGYFRILKTIYFTDNNSYRDIENHELPELMKQIIFWQHDHGFPPYFILSNNFNIHEF